MKNFDIRGKIAFIVRFVFETVTFILLLLLFIVEKSIEKLFSWRIIPAFLRNICLYPFRFFYEKAIKFLERKKTNTISRIDLIELAIKNMRAKKTRTKITIGGMMIGIGAIVFLVSIGYGLQDMVISRVARLDEMKQINVFPQTGGKMKIDDKTLADFKDIPEVEMVLPLIAVVGRVNYQNSVSDVAVYGVTTDYLKQSAIKPAVGDIFDSNEFVFDFLEPTKQVKTTADVSMNVLKTQDLPKGWVSIDSESNITAPLETKVVSLSERAKRQAVVSRSMLSVLGITENTAVGEKFTVSFVIVGDLLVDSKEKIESESSEYTIVGVMPEEKNPVFYVPFIDVRSLGITNYSQVKVVVKDQADFSKTRRQIEAMGYVTGSVVDTVAQINSLFATARMILALVGMVALAVAALGMFNTLTVSLLERTREVGLMKAMGMKSGEVQELFLTESMIMGFSGGILGILLGYLGGKLVGLILSFFTVFKGAGFVDVSSVPLSLALIVVALSLFIGLVTGIYPARRAKKISALNALRYE